MSFHSKRLPAFFGKVILLVWGGALMAALMCWGAWHYAVLPGPAVGQVAEFSPRLETNQWRMVHVLAAECGCSGAVGKRLAKRHAQPGVAEEVQDRLRREGLLCSFVDLTLIGAGAKLFFTKPSFASVHDAARATLKDYVWDIPQMFFLTITNPAAVLGLVAIFGGVSSFVEVDTYIDAFVMVAAIMGGSFLYWFLVSQFIATIRRTAICRFVVA